MTERLGDARDDIRNVARQALLSSRDALGAEEFFRLMTPAFISRKPKVKESVREHFASACVLRRIALFRHWTFTSTRCKTYRLKSSHSRRSCQLL
jgi:hypothetical protein